MADQIYPQNGIQSGRSAQPGLEAAPSRYSTAPIAYDPSEMQSPGEKSTWTSSQAYPVYTAPPGRRRILGLTVPVFWGLVAALAVILAGGIAGGVAGGLTALKANNSSTTSSSPSSATAGSQAMPTASGASSGPASSSRSSVSTATSSTSRSVPTGVRSAPTDDGCPNINQTVYTPTNGNGDAMKAGSGSVQSFQQLCEVNYPSGARYGNPELYDILKVYVPTFEECMALCASYNQGYSNNLANGNVASRGYCRSVAMIKLPGEYCYLKNGTGKMDTQGHPKDFISAVVISGLPDL
ncbi:hypothetical protein ColTof4_07239 [Colletotrichum tofieldiae]|uniref:Uncharacterized protein n=1 Tax=Colletotrichum tofieldiae TaxID=708197 RepID=A0A166UBE3_9PEZI|nr:hypothetical protein CT0861_01483 [Colletotrichum tofieldiae]GKT64841.1 hypothetical protein ColTof3_12180 [Colletotrichum tofieldiae]GKT74816.1 hypothetical protein ColTof4_07239 [Colletotrichum tofieldiae]